MRLVRLEDVTVERRAPRGRAGTNSHYAIFNPDLNGPDNFGFRLVEVDESFYSPRHHHNFDQYRYMIQGESDEAPEGKLSAGVLGYYPEGAYYGPESGKARKMLLLQFGASSGSGLVGRPQIKDALDALEKTGTFADGIYRRNADVEGPRAQDGFEAIWEWVHQRPVVYPTPQYARPILSDTAAFPWEEVVGSPGVAEKALGTYASAKLRCACYRLEAGASFSVDSRAVYFVLSGTGTVGGAPYMTFTSTYLDQGEVVTFTAEEATEILRLGLPTVDKMGLRAEPLHHVAIQNLGADEDQADPRSV